MAFEMISGVGAIVAAGVIWFGGQAVLTLMVRPVRRNLVDGIAYLRAHNDLTDVEGEMLTHLQGTACAVRASALVALSYLIAIITPHRTILRDKDHFAREAPTLLKDPRFDDIMGWYFVSTFAANPLFGILALMLRYTFRIRLALVLHSLRDKDHMYELPSLEAAQKA